MLGLFPKPYPDELLYSVFARYYVRSGYSNYIFAAEDLFKKRSVRPNFEYLTGLLDEVVDLLTKSQSFTDLLVDHTMFPYHCRFLPKERKEQAISSLISMDSSYHDLILFPKRKTTPTMRYCPECVHYDRKQYGETYWHRIHQIFELTICPIHHCYLINTDYKLSGKLSPDLIPAEIVIPSLENISLCENERKILLSQYIKEIFYMPIKMDDSLSVAAVLKKKTENTKYRSPRGEVCRITSLYNDFVEYYKGLIDDIPEQWKIHKLLIGQRFDFWEIVLLAFFLGIESSELHEESDTNKFQYEVFDNQIGELHNEGLSYPQIASQMDLSLNTIKNAVYSKNKRPKLRKKKGGKPGRRPIDWDNCDKEILPKVVETISGLKNSDKPVRITVGGVAKLVGLKSKQIDKLPLCKAEIEKYRQTQEELWAQKVVWAWGELSKEGRLISIKQIRLKTNMSIEQINRCLNELKNKDLELFDEISKLLNTRS